MCPLCKRRMARVHVLRGGQIVNSFDVEEREEPVVIPDEDDPVDEDAEESMNESDDPVSDEGCESWTQECEKISSHGCGSTASPTRCVRTEERLDQLLDDWFDGSDSNRSDSRCRKISRV